MKFAKYVGVVALAAAGMMSGPVNASVTLSNADTFSPFNPFGGFDWAPGAAAWTDGVVAAEAAFQSGGVNDVNNKFRIYYAAHAVGIIDPLKNTLFSPNLDTKADGVGTGLPAPFDSRYEYTIFAYVDLKVTSYEVLANQNCPVLPCVKISVESTGGAFDIYYDTNFNAKRQNNSAWTGFNDGSVLITGLFDAGVTNTLDEDTILTNPVFGFGLNGVVTGQDTNYINPTLAGTRFSSEFQFRQADPGFQTPTKVDSTDINQDPTVEDIFSVDGSQLFFEQVPEPMSLMLVGVALLGAGAATRRRRGMQV